MGWAYSKRPLNAPAFSVSDGQANASSTAFNNDMTFTAATNGVKTGRLVRIKAAGVVVPTTGTTGRAGIGITLSSASSGSEVRVRVFGQVSAVASTAALPAGSFVRGNAGPSTSSSAGTVRATTGLLATCIGVALTSAAAGAVSNTRTVTVLITHSGQVLA